MTGLFLASGCAPTVIGAGPALAPPRAGDGALTAPDGTRLPLRSWLPQDSPRAVIIALHGFNDYSFAFDDPGRRLAGAGIALYAYDQRGFGETGDRGYWAGSDTLSDDLIAAVRALGDRHPGKPVFLLGESMGGAVVMMTMARPDAPAVAGIVLAAPAVWNRSSMPLLQQAALWIGSHTLPWMTLTGRNLGIHPSDNIEMLRRLSRDPLVIKETRIDAIHGLCDLMDRAVLAPGHIRVPVLMLYGAKDEVVPAAPSLAAMTALAAGPGPAVMALYPEGYHMLLRDLEADLVIDDVAAWTARPGVPLPSGADRDAIARLSALIEARDR